MWELKGIHYSILVDIKRTEIEEIKVYIEYIKNIRQKEKNDEVEIVIPEGTNPEVYTEEQEKLLGDCESTWELYVDGYDEDGNRIYDPIKGEACQHS